MSTIQVSVQSLHSEISYVTRKTHDEGRTHLNNLEIEHLLKMTNDVLAKIKEQSRGMSA